MSDIPFEFDLSCDADNQFNIEAAIIAGGVNLSNYATKTELSSKFSELDNKIPLYTSQLIDDSGFSTDETTVSQTIKSGIEIGVINGTPLYAPPKEAVDLSEYLQKNQVSANLTSGALIATIGGVGIYAPISTSGDVDLSGYATVDYVNSRTTVRQTITSGTEIGSVNGTKLYAPSAVCVFG